MANKNQATDVHTKADTHSSILYTVDKIVLSSSVDAL